MLKLVIFDCDGVMIDSREANRAYYNHILARFGLSPMSEEELDYVHSHNVTDSVAFIFRDHPHIGMEQVRQFQLELDYTPFLRYLILEPDLLQFLQTIKPRYHTAISTNRTNTMPMVLEMFQLNPWFDKVVTALDVKRPKPAPDALRVILDHFSVDASEAVFIGDSTVDREHVQPFNMPFIAFKNPGLKADYHVTRFMELLELPLFSQKS